MPGRSSTCTTFAKHSIKVEIISGDHQNKPDLGSSIANFWFDVEKVDVIVGGGSSGVALAVSEVARQKNKVLLATEPSTSDLTGPKCNANTIHWTFDTWMLAHSTGKAVVKAGGNTWFFLTADYTFGHTLEGENSSSRRSQWRQSARQGPSSAQHERFLIISAPSAGMRGNLAS